MSQEAASNLLPPQVRLLEIVQGMMASKALQLAAKLGIADLLAEGPRSAAALAQDTASHPPSLYRVLRALASIGIFHELEDGTFENTELSEPLRSGVPGSVRDYVIFAPDDSNVRAWMHFDSVVRSGEPSFAAANGADNWEYFATHPALLERFNQAMSNLSALAGPMIAYGYDFSPFKSLVDIGGGEGRLLAAILAVYPNLKGSTLDLPAVAEQAADFLRSQGLEDRTEVLAGNAFEAIPGGYDAYIMRNVLHDWGDEKALALLANCRAAIPDHGKLVIFDAIMPPGNDPYPAKWIDLQMMVALGGRERSAEEFRRLLDRAGFDLTLAKPLPAMIGVVEGVPRRTPSSREK